MDIFALIRVLYFAVIKIHAEKNFQIWQNFGNTKKSCMMNFEHLNAPNLRKLVAKERSILKVI